MKTKTRKSSARPVKALCTLAVAAVLFVTGCVVTSVYPNYTAKDVVFDPALLGDWVEAGKTNQTDYVKVEQSSEKNYRATTFVGNEISGSDVVLFRLKQQLFLDSCPTNRSLDYVPVHQVSKVTRIGATLETANLNYDWLAKTLEKNPREIRHMILREKPGDDEGGRIVLSADTKELQRFILKNLNNTNAWKEPSKWKRRI